jgi:NAD-dependent dihydropyrimidine dehydrogenase PreA subunit
MRKPSTLPFPTGFLLLVVLGGASLAAAQSAGAQVPEDMAQAPFRQFAEQKGVAPEALAQRLGLPPGTDLTQPVGRLMRDHQISRETMLAAVGGADPVAAEGGSKDWRKIRIKFLLWVLCFVAAMVLLRRVTITRPLRAGALLAATLAFGVWLGVEPNAPGTIKDALVLYGEKHTVFAPRLIALLAFMLMSVIGNKVFCGWACQFGTLQDLVWHSPLRKWKPPFALSNAVRLVFFLAMAGAAVSVPLDILEPIDPFRVFRLAAPLAVGTAGVLLLVGLSVYRPWCNFFCPFGLVSWLGERVSLARVRVNHSACINCRACERACPTHSMAQLRAGRRFAQDCFACGACLPTCPVKALRWGISAPVDEPAAGTVRHPADHQVS